jgi:hypothetical protein
MDIKVTINIKEVNEILLKHFGLPSFTVIEIVDGESEWVENTSTKPYHPSTVSGHDRIEVEFADGERDEGSACSWSVSWNTQTSGRVPIVRYRKIKE